jgi:hypothetical protein
MIKNIAAVLLAAVMILIFPLRCQAAQSTSESSGSSKSSTESTDDEENKDGDWKIFLSIGAGIIVVGIVIGAIASKDAK